MENFANAPTSITEARSTKANDARLCTPRDILIETLREIDRGELDPELLVIAWQTKPSGDDERVNIWRRQAGPATTLGFLGLLTRVVHLTHTDLDGR